MQHLHINTPVIQSELFKEVSGKVFLKLDNLQPTGSFKIRGIGLLCLRAYHRGARNFISSSGGNAGLAAAYAGRKLNAHVKVIVPETTSEWAQKKIKQQGADLVVHGKTWAHADDLARELVLKNGYVYVPPFDHPDIFDGNSSLVHELKTQIEKPTAIVLAIGGGGLMCGVISGLKAIGWHDVKVYASETKGAASFHAAMNAGQPVDIGKIDTVAVTLGATEVAAQAFLQATSHETFSKVVTDHHAVTAAINFANNHRMLVEPSCGAALSLLEHDANVQKEERILVIICGGTGVNLELMHKWQTTI